MPTFALKLLAIGALCFAVTLAAEDNLGPDGLVIVPKATNTPGGLPEGSKTLEIGASAPDFSLKNIDGTMKSLGDYVDRDILAIVFTCNHCPSAQFAEGELNRIAHDFSEKSVEVIAISSNSPLSVRPDELRFCVRGDSYEDMIAHAKDNNFAFDYLYDGDTQETAMAYGAVATPHIFIFDKQRVLRYQGMIMAKGGNPDDVTYRPAYAAIESLVAQTEIEEPKTRAHGCSTKWRYKIPAVEVDNEKWAAKPVTLATIDDEGVKKLVAGDGKTLRMINIWATYCGPCIAEMPHLAMLERIYQHRPFELITITTDEEAQREAALNILKENQVAMGRHALKDKPEGATNNFIWHNDDYDALAEALDPEWPGPLPYTILVSGSGEIIYREGGEIDISSIRKAIVDHMGRWNKNPPKKKAPAKQ